MKSMNDNSSLGKSIGIVNGYHVVRSTSYNKDNAVISTSVTEVDYDAGFAETTVSTIYRASGKTKTGTHRIYVDKHGRQKRWESQRDGDMEYINYEYNHEGLLSRSHAVMGGRLEQFVDHAYDANGRLVSVNSKATYGGNRPRIINVELNYDSIERSNFSSIVHEILHDDAGQKTTENISHRTYIIDEKGQMRQRLTTSNDANKLSASEEYEYDINGNVVTVTYLKAGTVQSKTAYEYEKSRNAIFNQWLHTFRFSY